MIFILCAMVEVELFVSHVDDNIVHEDTATL